MKVMLLSGAARRALGRAYAVQGEWRRRGRSHGFWIASTRIAVIHLMGQPGDAERYRWAAAGKKGHRKTLRSARTAVISALKGPPA